MIARSLKERSRKMPLKRSLKVGVSLIIATILVFVVVSLMVSGQSIMTKEQFGSWSIYQVFYGQ